MEGRSFGLEKLDLACCVCRKCDRVHSDHGWGIYAATYRFDIFSVFVDLELGGS